jgi:predicted PurR-regulated permease PerM
MDLNDHNINISINAGTIFKAIVIVLLVVFLFVIKDLVLVVLTAIVLASSIEPLVVWMKKNGIRRLPAVIITYLTLALFASSLLYFFIPSFISCCSLAVIDLPCFSAALAAKVAKASLSSSAV